VEALLDLSILPSDDKTDPKTLSAKSRPRSACSDRQLAVQLVQRQGRNGHCACENLLRSAEKVLTPVEPGRSYSYLLAPSSKKRRGPLSVENRPALETTVGGTLLE